MNYLEQWNKIIISDEQRSYLLAFVDKPEPQQMVISQNIAGHLQVRILALTGALEVVICVFLSVYLSLTIFISSSHLQNCSSFLQAFKSCLQAGFKISVFKLSVFKLSLSSVLPLSQLSQIFLSLK